MITGERANRLANGGRRKRRRHVASSVKRITSVIGIAGVLGDGVEVVHRHDPLMPYSVFLPRLAPAGSGERQNLPQRANIARVIKRPEYRDSLSIKATVLTVAKSL